MRCSPAILALFLAAGAGADEHPAELDTVVVQAPEPRFVAPTRHDRIGRIWAPVLIDGKGPYRLVLDTGASQSAVTARTALNLGTPPSAVPSVHVTGFTGSGDVPTIAVDSLEIGDLALGRANLPVLADVFGGADGVLALGGAPNLRVVADFAHDRLEIARSHRERAPPGFAVSPLHMSRGGLPMVDVVIGGVQAKAIVDTGAQRSVGNLALRAALSPRAAHAPVFENVIGVTLATETGESLPSPDLEIGRITIRGMNIVFGDLYLFQQWQLTRQPILILGMDLLGSFEVLIVDFERRELQLRPRASKQ